jgi:tripeptidyl-peptidase-1
VAPTTVQNAGPESDLDFQVSYPLIYPQNAILFQTDDPVYEADYTFSGFLNTFLDALDGSYCSTVDPLDPPYPDPSNAAGAYKGQLQCGVYKPVSEFSKLTSPLLISTTDERDLNILRWLRSRPPRRLPTTPV